MIDSSALIAILRRQPEEQAFRSAIKLASSRLLSASTCVEIGIVPLGLAGQVGLKQVDALMETLRVETVPLSADHARLAIGAFRHFGKGRHPAGLNFGDDFSQTDVRRAV